MQIGSTLCKIDRSRQGLQNYNYNETKVSGKDIESVDLITICALGTQPYFCLHLIYLIVQYF